MKEQNDNLPTIGQMLDSNNNVLDLGNQESFINRVNANYNTCIKSGKNINPYLSIEPKIDLMYKEIIYDSFNKIPEICFPAIKYAIAKLIPLITGLTFDSNTTVSQERPDKMYYLFYGINSIKEPECVELYIGITVQINKENTTLGVVTANISTNTGNISKIGFIPKCTSTVFKQIESIIIIDSNMKSNCSHCQKRGEEAKCYSRDVNPQNLFIYSIEMKDGLITIPETVIDWFYSNKPNMRNASNLLTAFFNRKIIMGDNCEKEEAKDPINESVTNDTAAPSNKDSEIITPDIEYDETLVDADEIGDEILKEMTHKDRMRGETTNY